MAQVTPVLGGGGVGSGDSMGTVGAWEGAHSTPWREWGPGLCSVEGGTLGGSPNSQWHWVAGSQQQALYEGDPGLG